MRVLSILVLLVLAVLVQVYGKNMKYSQIKSHLKQDGPGGEPSCED